MQTDTKVLLVPSHKALFESPTGSELVAGPVREWPGTVQLNREILAWPMLRHIGKTAAPVEKMWERMERSFLEGLLGLAPFTATISFVADMDRKCLSHAHRGWGLIHYEENVVASFTHHKDTRPFIDFVEWAETDPALVVDWDPVLWIQFFHKKIRENLHEMDAETKIAETEARDTRRFVESVLPHLPSAD